MVRRTSSVSNVGQNSLWKSLIPKPFQLSFWKSLIPKPFRASEREARAQQNKQKSRSKEWNPATFFIVIFVFIGSMSIQQIALEKETEAFTRRADVRIAQLREVVARLQRGEEVPVEEALGSGDPAKEQEWEQVLHEVERGELAQNHRRQQQQQQQQQNEQTTAKGTAPSPEQAAATPERESTASPERTVPFGRATFF